MELASQPLEYGPLLFHSRASDLRKQPYSGRLFGRQILRALVAAGAEGTKIAGDVLTTQASIHDVTDVEADLSPCHWVDFSRRCAAHLAGEAISVQDFRAKTLGYSLREAHVGSLGWKVLKHVLSGLEGS
jgi:hypothetical protein